MIRKSDQLTIRHLRLEEIQIKECQERYPDRLQHYIRLMKQYPECYAGCLFVAPSDTHAGMYALLDGHHRFMASILCGRTDVLCVVVAEMSTNRDAQEEVPRD